ncbi:MAG: hypothetical protein MRY49_02265 [Candidatus Pacebacteria bacterium]|nr:hypothetical protein [Candidatus Paceibacterota bacterium]
MDWDKGQQSNYGTKRAASLFHRRAKDPETVRLLGRLKERNPSPVGYYSVAKIFYDDVLFSLPLLARKIFDCVCQKLHKGICVKNIARHCFIGERTCSSVVRKLKSLGLLESKRQGRFVFVFQPDQDFLRFYAIHHIGSVRNEIRRIGAENFSWERLSTLVSDLD